MYFTVLILTVESAAVAADDDAEGEFSGTFDSYTDGSSYTDEDEFGNIVKVHRRPSPEQRAAEAESRRQELLRIITSADELGTEVLPGQQVRVIELLARITLVRVDCCC